MKKYILSSLSALLILASVVVLTSCGDSTSTPVDSNSSTKGSILVYSSPAGAQIWVDGTNSSKVTPDSVVSIEAGTHAITLKLSSYKDTTFNVTVVASQQTKPATVTLKADVSLTTYGPVRIWETSDPSPSDPSGLCLSNGLAYSVTGTNKSKVDLYYSSAKFLVQSADLSTTMTRTLSIYAPTTVTNNLSDGISAPSYSASLYQYNAFADRDLTTYYFIYDNDHHYSKLAVTAYGGGTPGNPAWVELKWIYNNKVDDVRFK